MNVSVDIHSGRLALDYLISVRDELISRDETISEDETLLADMLDAEGGECMDILRRLLVAALDAQMMADAISARISTLKQRCERFDARGRRLLDIVAEAIRKLDLKKIETPEATLLLRKGSMRLEIANEQAVPRDFIKIAETVDKVALRQFLSDGGMVDGCAVVQGPDSYQVRTK